jgi:hypothetical protein
MSIMDGEPVLSPRERGIFNEIVSVAVIEEPGLWDGMGRAFKEGLAAQHLMIPYTDEAGRDINSRLGWKVLECFSAAGAVDRMDPRYINAKRSAIRHSTTSNKLFSKIQRGLDQDISFWPHTNS